jgi:hypothetical protein
MKKLLALLLLFGIVGCGPSAEEIAAQEQEASEIAKAEEQVAFLEEEKRKSDIATITCNVMGASRNMDGAFRIKEVNYAREKMGEELFLGTDEDIKISFTFGLCKELVLNDQAYNLKLEEMLEKVSLDKKEEYQESDFDLFVVKVHVFSSNENAVKMVGKINNGGFPAFTEVFGTNKDLHAVYVGPFLSEEDIVSNITLIEKVSESTKGEISRWKL